MITSVDILHPVRDCLPEMRQKLKIENVKNKKISTFFFDIPMVQYLVAKTML